MTAYNRQQFIAEAIESVMASTYINWELIIVDDGSKDDTVSISKSYAARDERIKVYVNEKNLGDYTNRNQAASYAKGKYLKYVDSDDTIAEKALETMVNGMEFFAEAGFGISKFFEKNRETNEAVCLTAKAAYEYHYFKNPIFFASPGLAIFCRKAFEAVGGFPENRMVSDFEIWHKMALHYPVVLLPPDLIHLRQHPGQELADQQKYVVQYEQIKLAYLQSAECPLTTQQVQVIKKQRRNTAFKIFIIKLLGFQFKAALPRLKVFYFYLFH